MSGSMTSGRSGSSRPRTQGTAKGKASGKGKAGGKGKKTSTKTSGKK